MRDVGLGEYGPARKRIAHGVEPPWISRLRLPTCGLACAAHAVEWKPVMFIYEGPDGLDQGLHFLALFAIECDARSIDAALVAASVTDAAGFVELYLSEALNIGVGFTG